MKKKILIIDDDEGILLALKLLLESEGYGVSVCSDGDKAADMVRTFVPQIILMDLLLSGKDGTDIVRELKKHSYSKNIPIIMMSAHPTAEDKVRKVGVTTFVPKPFETEELLKIIDDNI